MLFILALSLAMALYLASFFPAIVAYIHFADQGELRLYSLVFTLVLLLIRSFTFFAQQFSKWGKYREAEADYLENAHRFIRENSPDDALFIIERHGYDQDSKEANLLLAQIWTMKGDIEKASLIYEKLLDNEPDNIQLLLEYFWVARKGADESRWKNIGFRILGQDGSQIEILQEIMNHCVAKKDKETLESIGVLPRPDSEKLSQLLNDIPVMAASSDAGIKTALSRVLASWSMNNEVLSLIRDNKDPDTAYLKGIMALDMGDIPGASDYFSLYICKEPEKRQSVKNTLIKLMSGEYSVQDLYSFDRETSKKAGLLLFEVGMNESALFILESMVSDPMADEDIWFFYTQALKRGKRVEEAAQAYLQMVKKHPKSLDRAISQLSALHREFISQPVALALKQLVDLKEKQIDRIKQLSTMQIAGTIDENGLKELAQILYSSSFFERCIAHCNRIRMAHPEYIWPFEYLFRSFVQLNEYESALKIFYILAGMGKNRASTSFAFQLMSQESLNLRQFIARLCIKEKKYDDADDILKGIVATNIWATDEKLLLAELNFIKGELEKSWEMAENFQDYSKEQFISAHILKARILLRVDESEKSLEITRKILENYRNISLEQSEKFYELALLFQEKKMMEEALKIYRKIALGHPDFKDILKRIRHIEKEENHLLSANFSINNGFTDEILARFQEIKIIGSGRLGRIYSAYDIKLDKMVALEIICPGLALNPKAVRRFLGKNKELLTLLDHPGITRIYDIVEGESPFIVMELVEGKTLKELGAVKKLSPKIIDRVLEGACSALYYGHSKNVVHLNIKPENIMLDKMARIKIMNFGNARFMGDLANYEGGELNGTLPYLAPEQIRGRIPDGRGDQYSLCFTVYQLLSGQLPFTGGSHEELLYNIFTKNPLPLHEISDITKAQAQVIERGMMKEPEERWPDMPSLLQAWRTISH